MKKVTSTIAFLIFLICAYSVNGQVKIGVYTGYSLSSFEAQESSADMLPLGAQVYYSLESVPFVSFNFGLDFNYSIIPFSFLITTNTGEEVFTREQNQLHLGALIKVKFAKKFILNPFIRFGAGLYSGNQTLVFNAAIVQEAQQKQIALPPELEVSSVFGFNFGGGMDIKFTESGRFGMFLEFVYHLHSREIDESPLNIFEGANFAKSTFGFNNWAILLGFQFGF